METNIIKRQFFSSLKRGTGEAYLLVKENPTIDFSDYIIKGALKNYAYDGQAESSRAQYIFDIISLTNKIEKIRNSVLKGLSEEQEDTWSLTHLFDLAKIFAKNGDNEARQAIYNRFLNHPIEYSDWVGYNEIIELDGLNGLLFISEKFGKWIEKNPDDLQDDWIIEHFKRDNPNINVIQELKSASKSNKYIKLYLDTIRKTKIKQEKHKEDKIEYKDIIDEVINSIPFLSFKRSMNLTESEIVQIADRFLIEKNKINQEKLLLIFSYYKFPFKGEIILNLAKQKTNSKNRIKEFAIYALKFLQDDKIREFALEKIPASKNPKSYIEILISNYKKGDFKLLTEIAKKFKNEHIIECLASAFIDIYRANKTKECKEPLEILYSKMTCGIHRNDVINVLIENDVLSNKIRWEIEFDSYFDTRKLID